MHTNHKLRLAGAAVFAAALAGGTLTASAGAADEHNDDPLGLIADNGGNCNLAQAAYVAAGWNPIDGDNFNNVIVGTPQRDFIRAFEGDDVVIARQGRDVVCLGQGEDHGQGNRGNDFIYGNPGEDVLSGNEDNDHLDGGPQADTCLGGPGADTFFSC